MKYVSLLFATLLIAGIANASEQKELNFSYSNHNAYYSCSYAEGQMAGTLAKLGMKNINVECSGGIEHNQLLPVDMHATFEQEVGTKEVTLRGRGACEFNVKMIKAILSTVNHEVVKASNTCFDADGSYRFEIVVH